MPPQDVDKPASSAQAQPQMEKPPVEHGAYPRQTLHWRRAALLIAAIAFVVVAIPLGIAYWHNLATHESTDDAFVDAHVLQISPQVAGTIVKVLVKDNQPVKLGDLLVQIDPRDYQAKLDKQLATLQLAEKKQRSAALNVGLTSTTTNAAVLTASSEVEAARSGVAQSESALGTAQTQVQAAHSRVQQAHAQVLAAIRTWQQARAQIPAAQAEHARTTADLARYQKLYKQDEVSRQQLDNAIALQQEAAANLQAAISKAAAVQAQVEDARAAEQTAQDGVRQALSQVSEAQARVTQTRAQVSQAQGRLASANAAPQQVAVSRSEVEAENADIAQAKADVKKARLDLSYTEIHAPQAGRVTRKAVEVGSYVDTGQALMALVPTEVWVTANFKETQLTHMQPGQKVDIRVDAYPGRVLHGHVDSIQKGTGARFSVLPPENATGNFVKIVQRVPVKIVFDESEEVLSQLGPGMSVVPSVRVQ